MGAFHIPTQSQSPISSDDASSPAIHIWSPVKRIKTRILEVLDSEREWRRRARAHLRFYRYGEDQRFFPFTDMHRGHFTTNLTFAYVRTLLAIAAFRAPTIVVSALRPDDEEKAPILESVLNETFENSSAESQFRKTAIEAFITGRSYTKIGYHTEFGYDPNILDARRARGRNTQEVEFDEYIIEERAFLKHASSFNIIRDPMVDNIHEGRWIAERFVRPLDTLQNDRRFNSAINKMTENVPFMGTDNISEDDRYDDTSGFFIDSPIWNYRQRPEDVDRPIEYYVYYDKRDRKIYTVADGIDEFISEPKRWIIDYNGFPYEELKPYDIPGSSEGTSIVEQIAWHQFEMNELRRFQVDMVKRQNPKFGMKRNAISLQDRDRLEQGVPAAILEMNGPEDLWELPQGRMTSDNYMVLDKLFQEMGLIAGISAPNLGGQRSGSNRTTATENVREQAGFQTRVDDLIRAMELHGAKCAEKLAAVITQMYTEEDYIRVVGQKGMEFQPYVGTELAGRYRFTSEVGSTTPNSEAVRRKQVLDAFTLFAQFRDRINIDELLRRTLKVFPELGRDYEKLLMTPQTQLKSMMEQTLMQQLATEVATPNTQIPQNGGAPEKLSEPPGLSQGVGVSDQQGLGALLSRMNKVTA